MSRLPTRCLLGVAWFLALSTRIPAQPLQWSSSEGGNDHFYEHVTVDGGVGWIEAERLALARAHLGATGHLVTIASQEEESFLRSHFPLAGVWIGLTDRRAEGVFEWVTGEPITFENWSPNEPNNAGDEDYVLYTSLVSGWNDSSDRRGNFVGDLHYSFVVEYPVEVGRFRRGDTDADGRLSIADPIGVLSYLFTGGSLSCLEAGDTNDDGQLDITDAVGLLGFLFLGTLPPPAPFRECGPDTDEDALDCESFPPCRVG